MGPHLRDRRGIGGRSGEQHGWIAGKRVRQQEGHDDHAGKTWSRSGYSPKNDPERSRDFDPAHQ
jgi:hypothetical protein